MDANYIWRNHDQLKAFEKCSVSFIVFSCYWLPFFSLFDLMAQIFLFVALVFEFGPNINYIFTTSIWCLNGIITLICVSSSSIFSFTKAYVDIELGLTIGHAWNFSGIPLTQGFSFLVYFSISSFTNSEVFCFSVLAIPSEPQFLLLLFYIWSSYNVSCMSTTGIGY